MKLNPASETANAMKLALIAINTSYSHCALAIKLLEKQLKEVGKNCVTAEFTINEPYHDIFSSLYQLKAQVYCFSCYIWNITMVQDLAADLKKVLDCKIVLGGPEVSYRTAQCLTEGVDYIVSGEGDAVMLPLVEALSHNREISISCVSTRTHLAEEIAVTKDISNLGTPYLFEEMKEQKNRIFYYESSRGCPYSCSFCLSSLSKGVRFVHEAVVLKDISKIVDAGIKIVKFTDRTFNCDKKRAMSLFYALAQIKGDCVFHFEMCAHLIDDEMMKFLKTVRKGKFQFEIGIQSVDENTIDAVHRTTDTKKILNIIAILHSYGNIHIHIDLIAGLPYDTYAQFQKSFDRSYYLCDMLQLGFLKMLHGTEIRRFSEKYAYCFSQRPPYEIFSNEFITYDEILKLKCLENVLQRFKNSGFFKNSLSYLETKFSSPFEMLLSLGMFLYKKKQDGEFGLKTLFLIFYNFFKMQNFSDDLLFMEYLRIDYILKYRDVLPEYFHVQYDKMFLNRRGIFLRDRERVRSVLGKEEIDVGYCNRFCEIHRFQKNGSDWILFFNREDGSVTDITNQF